MTRPTERMFFEEQRFPGWIKAMTVLPIAVLAAPAVMLLLVGPPAIAAVLGIVVLISLPLVVLNHIMRLATIVDETALRLRIHPRWSPLPARMKHNDVPLHDIHSFELRSYNSMRSAEFWGWHFWGLSAGRGQRYLYVMRPSGPASGRGVYVETRNGGKLLVGSAHPEELLAALTEARRR